MNGSKPGFQSEGEPRRERGRPREFDEDRLLDAIMVLFWHHGYDGVTLSHIEEVAGVNKASLYHCFGNKEQLFLEALDRYERSALSLCLTRLNRASSLSSAVHQLLRGAVDDYAKPELRCGCMLLTGTVASHPDNAKLVLELSRRRIAFHRRLANTLGQWSDSNEAVELARCAIIAMQGIALQAHDGVDRTTLYQSAERVADGLSTPRAN